MKHQTVIKLLTLILFLGGAWQAFGAPPENDNFADALEIGANGYPYSAHFTASTLDATSEPGEPQHLGEGAGRSIWYKWVAPASPRPVQIGLYRSNFDTVLAIYRGTALNNLVYVTGNRDISNDVRQSQISFTPQPGTTYYIAVDGNAANEPRSGSVGFDLAPAATRQSNDYDGDGLADVAVYRPSNGTWYAFGSADRNLIAQKWGSNGDVPVTGDYTRILLNTSDFAVFRPSNGTWYISHNNSTQSPSFIPFGAPGDVPVMGDFIGNQETDVAVYRPSTGTWYFQTANAPFTNGAIRFGQVGDVPVPGDYDADNRTDVAVFRPADGTWYINSSENGLQIIRWGLNGDLPVRGDFDGDAINDLAVFRPSNGTWYVRRSSNGALLVRQWGLNGDLPVSGDFDGDGRFDLAVYRASNSTWYVSHNGGDPTPFIIKWGLPGDYPLTGNQIP